MSKKKKGQKNKNDIQNTIHEPGMNAGAPEEL